MYLKRLEIRGFKSFADKVEIDFEEGITGVVGPNGSGKSNISDSIRWVLGEQSAKTLRGNKMEDIIFSGTTTRKPLGMAEVSLTLDNTSKKLPIDYEEVTITRRVYRSGESEYYINKSSCRLKDVRELLMDTGIGKEGYSIIGQGKIDEILSNKSEDRRQIFEEAAGIVKYKSRKEEALRKLAATNENLTRVIDILYELEKQLEPLKRQSIKAQKFIKLKEQLLQLEVNLFIREIDKIDDELKQMNEQILYLNNTLQEQTLQKNNYEEQFKAIENLLKKYDGELRELELQYHQDQNHIEKVEGQIVLSKEKLRNNNDNIIRIQKEIDDINNRKQEYSMKLEEKLKQLQYICDQLEGIQGRINDRLEQYQKAVSLNDQKEREVEDDKGWIIDGMNEISDKKSELNGLQTLLQTMNNRWKQVNEEMRICQENLASDENTIEFLTKELKDVQETIYQLTTNIRDHQQIKEQILEQKKMLIEQINEMQSKMRNKEARKNIIQEMEKEHEGFNKSVKNTLMACRGNSDLGEGVYGTVADLIKVPKGLEVSIETALGPAIQYIVCHDEHKGKKLIQYLKHHQLGRITVLPLSTIKGRSIDTEEMKILKLFGDIRIAYEVVAFDKEYSQIFSNLLSRVLIAPNIDRGIEVAKKLQYKFKIVTLDGDVLNAGGSMTGGSTTLKSNGILGRKRELEDLTTEVSHIKKELEKTKGQYDVIIQRETTAEGNFEKLTEELQSSRIQSATLKSKIEQKVHEKNKTSDLLIHKKREIDQIKETINETNITSDILKEEIEGLESNIRNKQEKVLEDQKFLAIERENLDKLNMEVTQYKINLATAEEQKKTFLQEIEDLQEQLKNYSVTVENKKIEIEAIKTASIHYEQDERKAVDLLKILNANLEKYEASLKKYRRIREEKQLEGQEIRNQLQQTESIVKELQESIHKLEVKRTRLEMQQQGFYSKLWEDYELTYSQALEHKKNIKDIGNTNKEVKGLKDEIRSLGVVNMESINEYEAVKERYDFLNNQQADLRQAEQSLLKVINDMEKTMKNQFFDQFHVIKKNFNQVFIKLFGGGKADLVLENEDNILECGIDIIAQPPGKKLQNLSLLSGGERALTAISLLFAILQVKPSPFCILDEIEAALDDANVYRFAQFLKELSVETQFIVVTHRKGTMESTDALYGVTMEEEGVSKLVSVKLKDIEKDEIAS